MACPSCGRGLPQTPLVRTGYPTVWAWGPFPDHQPADQQQVVDFLTTADASVQSQQT